MLVEPNYHPTGEAMAFASMHAGPHMRACCGEVIVQFQINLWRYNLIIVITLKINNRLPVH